MNPSWRKPFGMLMLLLLIALWASLVLLVSPWIERLPGLVQAVVYLVLGIVWILPLKPMLRWMETGVWKSY